MAAAGGVLVVLAREGTPPGQGGIEILARGRVDIDSIVQLVFQQSKSYVFFALQFLRQSAGHSSCATEGRFHSAVLEQRLLPLFCTTVAHGPDSAAVAFTAKGRRHPWFRTVESASDSVIDRAQ